MSLIPLSAFHGVMVNGLGPTFGTPISGYTLATPFTCSLSADPIYTEAAITTEFTLIWWFGDGTYSVGYSPSHIYNWPGVYEIKCGIFNTNPGTLAVKVLTAGTIDDLKVIISGTEYIIGATGGIDPHTFSITVTANNYITDALAWDYSAWPDLSATSWPFHGYQSCKTGTVNGPIPISFDYTTSILDNSNILFNFYSESSLSQPWTEVPSSQLVNMRPRWRFTTVATDALDPGTVISSYNPVSSTEIRILSSGILSATGTLVGLSGSVDFYYVDDIPSLVIHNTTGVPIVSAHPTTIWVTLDASNLPNAQTLDYINVPSYANSNIGLSSYFYVQSLLPDHFEVTLNGKVPFYETYWPRVESRFVTTVNSYSGTNPLSAYLANKPLLNFPLNILSASNAGNTFAIALSTNTSSTSATFNTSTSPATGNLLTYNLSRVDSLGRDTGGYYSGTFTPYTTGSALLSSFTLSGGGISYVTDLSASLSAGFNPLYMSTSTSVFNNSNFYGTSLIFDIVDFDSTYFARKFGQSFDYGAALKSYALQPTINQNEVLFDTFLPAVAGVSATTADTFGGVAFEKIANFVSNVSDPSTANVAQFYSLADFLGQNLDNYNYDIPPSLSRIVDLYSVQQSKIWGARSQFNRNFSNLTGHTNLGSELSAYDVYSTMITAGQKIVANDMFNTEYYELIEVGAITSYSALTARGLSALLPTSAYPVSSYPLSTYPLSAFFGWGLTTPVASNYRFYVHDNTVDGTQSEGLVNWDDPITALSESASAHQDWVKDEGILETIFNYYIHKGLGLIK